MKAIFLDLDGVIIDQSRMPQEWRRHVGHVLATHLGGVAAEWSAADEAVFPSVWFGGRWRDRDPVIARQRMDIQFIRETCERVGVPAPPPDVCVSIGRAKDVYVGERTQAIYPGSADAIRELRTLAPLHMASGNPSYFLDAVLRGLGVRDAVGQCAGPDLVGVAKGERDFYPRVCEAAGVSALEAVVVDDQPDLLALARASGMTTVWVLPSIEEADTTVADLVVPALKDLPAALRRAGLAV